MRKFECRKVGCAHERCCTEIEAAKMTSGFKNWTCDPEWHELEAEPLIELPGKWVSANWYNSVIPRPKAMRYKVGDEVTCIDIPQWGNCRIEHIKIHKDGKQGCFIRQITGGDNAIWCLGEHLEPARRTSSEKDIPPEWCKPGALVVFRADNRKEPGYGRIVDFAIGGQKAYVTEDGIHIIGAFDLDRLRPARVRPWTFVEAPPILKVRDIKTGALDVISLCCDGHGELIYCSCGKPNIYTLKEVSEKFEQLDGSPCGVVEVGE